MKNLNFEVSTCSTQVADLLHGSSNIHDTPLTETRPTCWKRKFDIDIELIIDYFCNLFRRKIDFGETFWERNQNFHANSEKQNLKWIMIYERKKTYCNGEIRGLGATEKIRIAET